MPHQENCKNTDQHHGLLQPAVTKERQLTVWAYQAPSEQNPRFMIISCQSSHLMTLKMDLQMIVKFWNCLKHYQVWDRHSQSVPASPRFSVYFCLLPWVQGVIECWACWRRECGGWGVVCSSHKNPIPPQRGLPPTPHYPCNLLTLSVSSVIYGNRRSPF